MTPILFSVVTCLRVATAILLLASVSSANLLTNGSFEQGNPQWNQWGWQSMFPPDSFTIPGWMVTAGSVDYVGSYWQAAHGQRTVDLNGLNAQGTIQQSFSTVPGVRYLVTFALAGNPDPIVWGDMSPPRLTTVRSWVSDGATVFAFADFDYVINTVTRSAMGWIYQSWTFTALSNTTTLGFTSLDSYAHPVLGISFGPALDDVSVVAIPEPAPLILAGFGLVAVGFLRCRGSG